MAGGAGSADAPGGLEPAVLAGPTCDGTDVMYARGGVPVPLGLAEGDEIRFHAAGAYTSGYTTTFNGLAPLEPGCWVTPWLPVPADAGVWHRWRP